MNLSTKVLIGAVIGATIGISLRMAGYGNDAQVAMVVGLPGQLWLRSLRLVVLPLLFSSMATTSNSLKQLSNASSLGKSTVIYYTTTTFLAVITGMLCGFFILGPLLSVMGDFEYNLPDKPTTPPVEVTPIQQVATMFNQLVPKNIFEALGGNNLLGCIMFAIVVGAVVPVDSLLIQASMEVNEAMFNIVSVIIVFTPIGVCFLIAPNAMSISPRMVLAAGAMLLTLLCGFIVHAFIVYPMIYRVIMGHMPWKYYKGIAPAWLTAFGTSSSAATMPVTLQCVLDNNVPRTVAKFVVTLGATVNMDGCAVAYPIIVMWLAATVKYELGFGDYLMLIFMSTLSAVGASPIPSSSIALVKMITISLKLPAAIDPAFGLFAALEALIGRGMTFVNITGDAVAAAVVAKTTAIALLDLDSDESVDVPLQTRRTLEMGKKLSGTSILAGVEPGEAPALEEIRARGRSSNAALEIPLVEMKAGISMHIPNEDDTKAAVRA